MIERAVILFALAWFIFGLVAGRLCGTDFNPLEPLFVLLFGIGMVLLKISEKPR